VAAEDSLTRAEQLLEELEQARAELERVAQNEDPDAAIEVLQRLAELARDVEAELQRARREAGA
jgi:hypothetical protein